MHHATDFTVRASLGGYHGERRAMWIAAVFWFFMVVALPLGIVFLA